MNPLQILAAQIWNLLCQQSDRVNSLSVISTAAGLKQPMVVVPYSAKVGSEPFRAERW